MSKTFFASDHHFGHANIALKFTDSKGNPARINPSTGQAFVSLEEMNEYMVQQWNSVVRPEDRVYHLGDFCMPRKGLQFLHRLNGRICIVLGNHDVWKKKDWEQFKNVDQLAGVRMFPKLGWVCTHMPIHPRQFEYPESRWKHNIHGHTHNALVSKKDAWAFKDQPHLLDKRYFNVSVEQIDYTPIEMEELKAKLDENSS